MTGAVGIGNEAVGTMAGKTGKYLTFTLGQEEYGIAILKVKEIIGMMPITSVPRTPDYLKGVINLRGKVIPVLDLRVKFSMNSIPYSDRTCIIVVEIKIGLETMLMGVVVDTVSEVVTIQEDETEEVPDFGTSLDTDYILGMAKLGTRVMILLDIDRVLTADECTQAINFS